ncbi:U-box domain-containing protein 5 [Senna tora]|uniref:RING-type E3 ubiquitin transferase n=1 Tax=Senna tora TaxID=362788 RepID=A0A834TVD1_9FABA|nr:U-box domain-containing protein 5 [Senna tora]
MKLVDRITKILPDIEAARPRCSLGIQSLCSLNSAIDKAKLLLQHCCDCSKLYLAMTGDVVLSRCQKARKSIEQNLDKIRSMVPVMLSAEISRIIDDLGCVSFALDSFEEEAGKAVRELLQKSASDSDLMEDSEIKALQIAAARLNITSSKAILTEKRSIRKLLDKVAPNEATKKMILRYLLYLLKKYGNYIIGKQMEKKVYARSDEPFAPHNSSHSHCAEMCPCLKYGQCSNHTHELSRGIPPEEYKCPISSKLMYDPVVIASGATYERTWIQKWFDEGHDICPKTGEKLAHMSLTSNMAIKDLISKWCTSNRVTLPNPSRQAEKSKSWESSSISIRSFEDSMNNLHPPRDFSNLSLGSVDSNGSDSSQALAARDLNSMLMRTIDNSQSHQSHANIDDSDLMLLSKFPDLEWDTQCLVIEDLKFCLKGNSQAFCNLSSENFIESLVKFLNNAYDLQDSKALRDGTQLLLEFVIKCRNSITYLGEDASNMLGNLLDSEVTGEALAILEELSGFQHSRIKIAVSSALTSILKILDSESREFQQAAIRIMYNLSFNSEACSHMVSLRCIPKFLPFFADKTVFRYCIRMLRNICDTEEGRVSVVETEGCISAIAEVLETGSNEEQEHALTLLLNLCSQCVDYCQLVMEQGIMISSLFYISKNGNDKGKENAMELIRLLRDVTCVKKEECLVSAHSTSSNSNDQSQQKKAKKCAFFKMLSWFSKSCSRA